MILHDENVDVVPNPDPRTLQHLVMALSEEEFKRITELLSLTPNLTPNEFRNMLLDEEKKRAAVASGPNEPSMKLGTQGPRVGLAGGGEGKGQYCDNCKKEGHHEDQCWLLHPELSGKPPCSGCGKIGHEEAQCWRVSPKLAPAWLQKRLFKPNNAETKGKRKDKKANASCLSNMVEED